jgi:hypothetical protein
MEMVNTSEKVRGPFHIYQPGDVGVADNSLARDSSGWWNNCHNQTDSIKIMIKHCTTWVLNRLALPTIMFYVGVGVALGWMHNEQPQTTYETVYKAIEKELAHVNKKQRDH